MWYVICSLVFLSVWALFFNEDFLVFLIFSSILAPLFWGLFILICYSFVSFIPFKISVDSFLHIILHITVFLFSGMRSMGARFGGTLIICRDVACYSNFHEDNFVWDLMTNFFWFSFLYERSFLNFPEEGGVRIVSFIALEFPLLLCLWNVKKKVLYPLFPSM